MEDGSDLKTTALERIERKKQGRLSWSELQPRTNQLDPNLSRALRQSKEVHGVGGVFAVEGRQTL